MNGYTIVLLITSIIYASLLTIVLHGNRTRLRARFSVYVVVSLLWSASTFLLFTDFGGFTRVWASFTAISGACLTVAYYNFVCAFVQKRAAPAVAIGYSIVASVLIPLACLGYIPQQVSVSNGRLTIEYGPFLYMLMSLSAAFLMLSVWALVRRYRSLKDAESRNKVIYLLGGLFVLVVFGARTGMPPTPSYPIEHIGHLGNALLITYAITRHRLLDVKLVARKGLAYSFVSIVVTAVFLIVLLLVQHWVRDWTSSGSLIALFGVALILAWAFNPMRTYVQKIVDRIFYGETYDYRQLILSFAQRMNSVLDLRELAEAILKPIVRSVKATQASILLPTNSDFTAQFAERLIETEPVIPIKLGKDSPVVKWLQDKNMPLSRESIDIQPEMKALWESERSSIDAVEMELLVPMQSKDRLVGILALSRKGSGGPYSSDDIDLLVTLASEASVALENAQLYALAKERAHIDELTGLFNHRYFHERLDEEISRSSRFGDIFSLIFMDLDLFKIYNDVYGHLSGDSILKQIGQTIKGAIRSIDIAYRYGGDEFTIVLPQASVEDARKVAERIRKRIESEMDSRGVSITCSIGIASWPTDGVVREELLRAADAALYYSKQAGRNRISLAPDVIPSRALELGPKPANETGVLSTIYALAATVDAKDHYTYGHSKKVSKYATEMAEAFGFSEDRIIIMRAAALLHDIGKIGVSDTVLAKNGKLNEEEWDSIRAHPKLGVAILKHVEGLSACLAAIQYHHERWDGFGYPAGLKAENIPLDARILAVADCFDAMTSLRPYRQGKMTDEEALKELERCAGTQFDPKVVEVFASLIRGEKVPGKKAIETRK